MVNAILAVLLVTLAAVAAKPNAGIEQDIAQEKFFFNFPWIALPSIPTRQPATAAPVVTPTLPVCTVTAAGAVASKVAAACTCGTTAPVKNCVANDVCTVSSGVGTCSTTLANCPTVKAAAPAACECKGTTTFVCVAPDNGCASTTATACT